MPVVGPGSTTIGSVVPPRIESISSVESSSMLIRSSVNVLFIVFLDNCYCFG